MFMPMKPIIAPFLFPAAVFIASACACTMCAAAMLVLRKTADFCSSLMVASSSAEAVTELTPTATMARPRVAPHLPDRTSFMACASSMVWPGKAEYRMPWAEIRANAGCKAVRNSDFSWLSSWSRV